MSDELTERRATSVRLTKEQLKWVKNRAVDHGQTMQDVIEDAIVAQGAPADPSKTAQG